jgi:hypothetical protein
VSSSNRDATTVTNTSLGLGSFAPANARPSTIALLVASGDLLTFNVYTDAGPNHGTYLPCRSSKTQCHQLVTCALHLTALIPVTEPLSISRIHRTGQPGWSKNKRAQAPQRLSASLAVSVAICVVVAKVAFAFATVYLSNKTNRSWLLVSPHSAFSSRYSSRLT